MRYVLVVGFFVLVLLAGCKAAPIVTRPDYPAVKAELAALETYNRLHAEAKP